MSDIMKNLKSYCALLLSLMASACEYVHVEDTIKEELGVMTKDYELPAHEGFLSMSFVTNGQSTITGASDADWLVMPLERFDKDTVVVAAYEANDGFPRKATLVVSLDMNPEVCRDTIFLRQRGLLTPYVTIQNPGKVIYNVAADTTHVRVNTNLPVEAITIQKRILDGTQEWITDVRWEDSSKEDEKIMVLSTIDNDGDAKRTAAISLMYDNGWNETNMVNLRLTQLAKGDALGTLLTFEEVRSLASEAGEILSDDFYIEGYVVSDIASGNVNENTQLSSSSINYDVCRCSSYIESLDGTYGFLVMTAVPEDNIFAMNTKVRVSLGGVTARKYNDPERYVLDGLTASSLMESEIVPEDEIPLKERYMNELTDADIYTRVTLKDVEWPVRKGSLSPCFERMTNAADVDAATKFATLLRDINGSSMYVYTNSTCVYRRDGTKMPYGSGTMSGVIVHEDHEPFVNEIEAAPAVLDLIGMGRYQIRHFSRSDFQMAEDFTDSFSEMICEFRYMDKDPDTGVLSATYGSGTITHTYSTSTIEAYYDFSYLGPVGTGEDYYFGKNFGNVNGFGIITEQGEDYGLGYEANIDMYSAGRTARSNGANLSWAASYWWNSSAQEPYYWVAEFSTKGIQTNSLSLQLSMLNQCQVSGKNTPRYWRIEWGEQDEESTTWNKIGEFALPDITPTGATLLTSMSCAFKPMNFELPLEMLGKKVQVRIGPALNNAGQALGKPVYQGNEISSNALGAGSMTYFAIRYNK